MYLWAYMFVSEVVSRNIDSVNKVSLVTLDSFWRLVRVYRPIFWHFKNKSWFLKLNIGSDLETLKVYLLDKRSLLITLFFISNSFSENHFLVCKLHTSHATKWITSFVVINSRWVFQVQILNSPISADTRGRGLTPPTCAHITFT